MYSPKTKRQLALEKAINIFRYLNNHQCISKWRKLALENYGFYDGSGQWEEEARRKLEARKQPVITVNKIKSRVDRLTGMEIQARTRIQYRSHLASNQQHQFLANAISKYALYLQEFSDAPKKDTWKFTDGLITGIGWSNLFIDPLTNVLNYEYVNPFNVLWDVDDLSLDLSDMRYVCRVRWYPIELAKTIWHKNSSYFDSMYTDTENDAIAGYNDELAARNSNFITTNNDGISNNGNKVLIVEVQYKERKKYYYGTDKNNFEIKTFNEEEALNFLDEKEIKEDYGEQTVRVLFSGNELLEYSPLHPNIPNQHTFTYLPFINGRRYSDSLPDPWIDVMKDLQREINHRRAKLVANLNSKRIFVSPQAFPGAKEAEILYKLQESTINVLNGNLKENILIDNDVGLSPGQFNILETSERQFEDVGAMYSEMMGKESGVKTGIGIQSLQSAAARAQTTKIDDFRYSKKQVGRQLLTLIQGHWGDILNSGILSNEEQQLLVSIAAKKDKKNGLELVNDIRTIPLDIYVEQSPDYESSLDENRAMLQSILATPNAPFLLQSVKFLEVLGIRNAEELAKEMQAVSQRQSQQQQTNNMPQPNNIEESILNSQQAQPQ